MPETIVPKEDLVAVLRQSVPKFNEWRARNPAVPVDLSGVDLGGVDLRGANFRGADLVGANLIGASIGGADFRRAKMDRKAWETVAAQQGAAAVIMD